MWLVSESCMFVTPVILGLISRTNQIAASESVSYGRKFASVLSTAVFGFCVKQEKVFTFGIFSPFPGCILGSFKWHAPLVVNERTVHFWKRY